LILATAFVSMRLSKVRETTADNDATIMISVEDAFSTDERRKAAGALWGTWLLLSDNPQPEPVRLATNGDGAPPISNAGNPLLAGMAIVVGAVAAVVVGIYVAQKAAEVIDRQLTRREDTQRLIASQASALRVLATHAKLEETAGHELPLTEAEQLALGNLQVIQNAIIANKQPPLPSPVPSGSDVGQGVGQGMGFGMVLAAVAAWFLFVEKR
jgi:hypothetical protein